MRVTEPTIHIKINPFKEKVMKPLLPGTNIKYGDDVAVVVQDYRDENNPNDSIRVEIDGIRQDWYWYWDGIECEVVETTKHLGGK